jgi:hypothetical protein
MTKPKLIATSTGVRRSAGPRTAWFRSMPIAGHRWMLVADEHVQPLDPKLAELPAALWMVNITDETRPIPVGCFSCRNWSGPRRPDDGVPSARRNHHGNEVPPPGSPMGSG